MLQIQGAQQRGQESSLLRARGKYLGIPYTPSALELTCIRLIQPGGIFEARHPLTMMQKNLRSSMYIGRRGKYCL